MIRRPHPLICLAGEKTVSLLVGLQNGDCEILADLPLEAILAGEVSVDALPREIRQADNQLLVIPDYWVGNRFHEFQSRKASLIAAFIKRKLKVEFPSLTEAGDFYQHAIVRGNDHRQLLYSFFLQETVAYDLYRCLDALGMPPLRITTPALIWQAKLAERIDGFADQGVGFVHLGKTDAFLYFYFMGQFLFSRQIQLPEVGADESQIYNLLSYEINQSLYLYSQKTKSGVDALFILASEPAAAQQLTDLLGREVRDLAPWPADAGRKDPSGNVSSCQGFVFPDLIQHNRPAITYRPLQQELTWRPMQWAGIAVGMVLVLLLALESGFLHFRSRAAERRLTQLESTTAEPPQQVLEELSQSIDTITRDLSRPFGSTTLMRALLSLPGEVFLQNVSLDTSAKPVLAIDAVVGVDDPESFRSILEAFLKRLNDHFDREINPLRETDVDIQLEGGDGDSGTTGYRIHLEVEIP